jgi:hypothetical protein
MQDQVSPISDVQRQFCRAFVDAIDGRVSAEQAESHRVSQADAAIKQAVGRLHQEAAIQNEKRLAGILDERKASQQKLRDIERLDEEAENLIRPLESRRLLPAAGPRAAFSPAGSGEAGLSSAQSVAEEALENLREAIKEWNDANATAGQIRALAAFIVWVIAIALLGHYAGSVAAFLGAPVVAGALISLLRVDPAVDLTTRLMDGAKRRCQETAAGKSGKFRKAYFGGLSGIGDATSGIGNVYLQSGTRAAGALYYNVSAAGVVAATGYILIGIVLAIAMLCFIFWIIAQILDS